MSTDAKVPTVFVSGATGYQGSALCRQLRALGWQVHGTTRNPASDSARALLAAGVQLAQGDWDDEDALRKGLAGCDKLYLCLLPNLRDLDEAPRRAERIASLARAAGVRQVVASTTLGTFMLDGGSAPAPAAAPGPFFGQHLRGQQRVEQAVAGAGFDSWTLLRPGFFMANFREPKIRFGYQETRESGSRTTVMTPESRLGLVDHEDIARFAVAAFRDPEGFHGRRLGLASEELLIQDVLDQLAAAVGDGRSIKAKYMTDGQIAEAQAQGSWRFFASEPCLRSMSDYIDMDQLTKIVPKLTTYEEFLEREKSVIRETYLS
ncbi:NmrA family protein [Hypoxylon sp. FL1284]|nr:NmrA family protein [Hypoxylon sp. FL1284]